MVRLSDSQFALLIIIPIIVLELALTGFPLLYSFYTSLTSATALGATFIGLENYAAVLQDPRVLSSLITSFSFSALVISLAVLLGIGLALLLNEEFSGNKVVRAIVLLPWALSEYSGGLLWRVMLNQTFGTINGLLYTLGIIDKYQVWMTEDYALLGVSIAYVWHFAPLGVFLLLAALQNIPQELYKAAKVDGANAFRRFRSITLPHIRYTLLIVLVLATMESFRSFDIFFAMTAGGPGTATTVLTWQVYRQQFQFMRYGYGAAVSYVLIGIMFAMAMIYFTVLTKRGR